MSPISHIIPWRAAHDRGTPHPADIDISMFAPSPDIERLAREAGERNEPEEDAPGPDAYEESIRHHYQETARQADLHSEAVRIPIQRSLDHHRDALDEQRFHEIPEAFRLALTALKSSMSDRLVAARADASRWCRTLRRFRDEHHLAHEPHHPESQALHVAILVALVLVEGLVNAWVFARVVPGGLLEGFLTAMIVAGMNVAFAFGAGNLMREVFHRNPWRRRLGWTIVGGYGLLLGAYTLLIGHWRLALLEKHPDAAHQAVQRLIHHTLAIDDAQTLLFVAISVGFALLAVWGGLTSQDRYPGYSRLWRAHRAALTRIDDLRAEFRAAVYDLWDSKTQEIEGRQSEAEEALHAVRVHTAEWQREVARYGYLIEQLCAADIHCARHYRRINSRIRTAPVPSWWDQAPEARIGPNPLFDTAGLAEAIAYTATLGSVLPRLREIASETRTRLGQAYDDAVAAERAFFSETDARAERDIRQDTAAVTAPAHAAGAPAPRSADEQASAPPAPLARRRGNGETPRAADAVTGRPH